ncbi:hypothetical protein MRX96_037342 [Rhipicephalus microplus]
MPAIEPGDEESAGSSGKTPEGHTCRLNRPRQGKLQQHDDTGDRPRGEEDRRRHRQGRRCELRASLTEEELKHRKELARENNRRRRAVRAKASRERRLQRLQEAEEKAAELVRRALGEPTLCDKCKNSRRNAQTATIPPLKGGRGRCSWDQKTR